MKPTFRTILLSLASAVALLFSLRGAAQTLSQPSSARAEIMTILNTQQEAWNRGDLDAFLQGYWHSPDLTFSGSSGISRGWDGVLQRYKKNYPDRAAMGHLTFSDLDFHALGPRAYLVLGKWHLDRSSGEIGGVFTLVFQHFQEGWRIIHDHTSLVPEKKK
jgi:L-asparaginase / beta-aspartyl-peptidase